LRREAKEAARAEEQARGEAFVKFVDDSVARDLAAGRYDVLFQLRGREFLERRGLRPPAWHG
jgi:hypothetical protein